MKKTIKRILAVLIFVNALPLAITIISCSANEYAGIEYSILAEHINSVLITITGLSVLSIVLFTIWITDKLWW